jgi:tetratricopeptide (TPR) repeat protein
LNPGLPNPIDSIAEMNLLMGNLDEAIAKYREALALNPEFYSSCRGLACVFALKEDYAEAENWLEEFIKRAPTPQAKMEGLWLTNFYDYLLGRLEKSLAAFLSFRSQAEKFKSPYFVASVDWITGFLYADRGEFDKARTAFQGWGDYVQQGNPASRISNSANQSFRLGWVDLKQGRPEAVKVRLREIENFLPGLEPADLAEMTFNFLLLKAEAALVGNSVEQAISIGEKIVFRILPRRFNRTRACFTLRRRVIPRSRSMTSARWPNSPAPGGSHRCSTTPSPRRCYSSHWPSA